MTITPEEFAQLTLETAAAGLKEGRFTATQLVEASFERIRTFEPAVNAALARNEEGARKRAAELDLNPGCASDGALRGMPVAFKDNLMTRGLKTTCASRILENFVPPYDATVVEKMNAAGAVLAAKTNMDEFAMGTSGENSAFGVTRNPWDLSRIPGGSSSGSAAMVAYGGVLASLATDTGGSIRQPASFCGLVGAKPTYGRVSRYGAAALASSLDQIGPITRTVRDNALMLDILTGYDAMDSTSSRRAASAAPCLPTVEDGVKGMRIGYDPSLAGREGFDPEQAEALLRAVETARAAGADIREIRIPLVDYGVSAYYLICACEASANLARFDGVRYGVRRGEGALWDIFSETRGQGFGDEVKRRIMMGSYALSTGYYDAYYLKAARVRRLLTQEFEKVMRDVDVILMPVSPKLPRKIGADTTVLENYLGDVFTLSANLTGFPAVSLPGGMAEGLPVGVQAMSTPFREDLAYRVARIVEKATALTGTPWTKATPETAK